MCWADASGFVTARPASDSFGAEFGFAVPFEAGLELFEADPEVELPHAATAAADTTRTSAATILRVIFCTSTNLPSSSLCACLVE
jgi:hypothetical protein